MLLVLGLPETIVFDSMLPIIFFLILYWMFRKLLAIREYLIAKTINNRIVNTARVTARLGSTEALTLDAPVEIRNNTVKKSMKFVDVLAGSLLTRR